MLQTTATNQRSEVIAFDLFGPLPKSSNNKNKIFIVEDVATRWVELFALEQATAEESVKILLNEIILRYGTPRRFISDNGTQFVCSVMQQLAYCLDITHGFTPVYHTETNPVERRNRDMKTQLALFVGDCHTTWPEKLASIRFAMNTAVLSSTGYSPAYLTFGRQLRTPDDCRHDFKQIILNENFVPEITPKLLMDRAPTKFLPQTTPPKPLAYIILLLFVLFKDLINLLCHNQPCHYESEAVQVKTKLLPLRRLLAPHRAPDKVVEHHNYPEQATRSCLPSRDVFGARGGDYNVLLD